jgi:hypothetical protein
MKGLIMSRQLDQASEERQRKRHASIAYAVEYGLEKAHDECSVDLLGFSVKCSGGDYLMTLRAELDGTRVIRFVGSDTIGGCFLKAVREATGNREAWRVDQWAK